MKSILITLLFFFYFLPILNGQVTIKGIVVNKDSAKVVASIYQHGSKVVDDFNGNFKLTIDSLGGTYFFDALGYYSKEVVIVNSDFLCVTLKKRKYQPRKVARASRRAQRAQKRYARQIRKGKRPITGGCCFVSGTKILMSNKSEENIENLKVGDSLLTYDFTLAKFIQSEIRDIDTVVHNDIIEVELERNIKIRNTSDHPYYVFSKGICSFEPEKTRVNYGIKTSQLQIGDLCYSYVSGKLVLIRINNISKAQGEFVTYNIAELDNNNNYLVNGVIVNNESMKISTFSLK